MADFLLHTKESVKAGSKAQRQANISGERDDPTAQMRVKARRRLIGAAVLLLAVVIIVPAILDPAPRPLPESIPIDIPGEQSAFAPRLSLPPLPQLQDGDGEAQDAVAAQDDAPQTAQPSESEALAEQIENQAQAQQVVNASAPAAEPAAKTEPKAPVAQDAHFVLQAAAFTRESSADRLAAQINAKGFKAYVRKVQINGKTHFRVRVGPYATHDEAQQAHARLRKAGIKSDLVSL